MGRKASEVEKGDGDADPEEHREQWRPGQMMKRSRCDMGPPFPAPSRLRLLLSSAREGLIVVPIRINGKGGIPTGGQRRPLQ